MVEGIVVERMDSGDSNQVQMPKAQYDEIADDSDEDPFGLVTPSKKQHKDKSPVRKRQFAAEMRANSAAGRNSFILIDPVIIGKRVVAVQTEEEKKSLRM